MRLIVFFDLPTITESDRRNYRQFHKFLVTNGFLMMQESIYSKLVLNRSVVELVEEKLKKATPKSGIVQLMIVTEKQYANIKYLSGKKNSKVLDSTERVVIL